jgi:acyl-[acyl-carrier-protein] desaturase
MRAVYDEVVGFAMPGAGMADFARNSVTIAKAGIYDLRLHHDEVVMPVLRHWRVFERTDLGSAGEQARDELAAFLAELDTRATRFVERRTAAAARRIA